MKTSLAQARDRRPAVAATRFSFEKASAIDKKSKQRGPVKGVTRYARPPPARCCNSPAFCLRAPRSSTSQADQVRTGAAAGLKRASGRMTHAWCPIAPAPSHPQPTGTLPLALRWTTATWHVVRKVKGMRVVNGKREWLVSWYGKNPTRNKDGQQEYWPDSWEPTANVSESAINEYTTEVKARKEKKINFLIDPTPLEFLGQRKVAGVVMGDANALADETNTSFGAVHELTLPELSLPELSEWYFEKQRDRFPGAAYSELFDKATRVLTKELRISEPEHVGDWCDFERFLKEGTGRRNIRYKLGRKNNLDAAAVAVIKIMLLNNKADGLLTVVLKIDTVHVNGIYGYVTPPHQVRGLLKDVNFKRKVIKYLRENMPRKHNLIVKGWHRLPYTTEALNARVAVPSA